MFFTTPVIMLDNVRDLWQDPGKERAASELCFLVFMREFLY